MSESETEIQAERKFKFLQIALTDVGLKREENQDSFAYAHTNRVSLFVVADGMGGANGGATASSIAIDTLLRTCFDENALVTEKSLREAFEESNRIIYNRSTYDDSLSGMGTTAVCLAFIDSYAIVGHVGDSRIYRCSNGKLTALTRDHTLVQELVDSGAIAESDAENHPIAHMLTRSLGPVPDVEPYILKLPELIQAKDRFLLCCDGLYNTIKDPEIQEFLCLPSLREASDGLLKKALERGAPDNVTVIVIDAYPIDDPMVDISLPEEGKIRIVTSELKNIDSGIGVKQSRETQQETTEEIVSQASSEDISLDTHKVDPQKEEKVKEEVEPEIEGKVEEDESFKQDIAILKPLTWFAVGMLIATLMVAIGIIWSKKYRQKNSEQYAYLTQQVQPQNTPFEYPKVTQNTPQPVIENPTPEPTTAPTTVAPSITSLPSATAIPQPTTEQVVQKKEPPVISELDTHRAIIEKAMKSGFLEGGNANDGPKYLTRVELEEGHRKKLKLREVYVDLQAKKTFLSLRSRQEILNIKQQIETDSLEVEEALKSVQELLRRERPEIVKLSQYKKSIFTLSNSGQADDVGKLADELSRYIPELESQRQNYQETLKRYRDALASWKSNPRDSKDTSNIASLSREVKALRLKLEDSLRTELQKSIENRMERIVELEKARRALDRYFERLNRQIGFLSAIQANADNRNNTLIASISNEAEQVIEEMKMQQTKVSDQAERDFEVDQIREELGISQ
jgi:PPM family protein phosphatase